MIFDAILKVLVFILFTAIASILFFLPFLASGQTTLTIIHKNLGLQGCENPLSSLIDDDYNVLKVMYLDGNNVYVSRGVDLCLRKSGTCPKYVYIKPSGHVHVTCKEKK